MKTRLFKYIVNIWALAFFTGFYSCSKDDESEPYIPIDEITVSIAELVPDKDTKAVSTTLTFKNIGEIDYEPYRHMMYAFWSASGFTTLTQNKSKLQGAPVKDLHWHIIQSTSRCRGLLLLLVPRITTSLSHSLVSILSHPSLLLPHLAHPSNSHLPLSRF